MSDFTYSDFTVADKAIWLDGVKTGNKRERERIIKLLEEHLGYGDSEWDANVKAIMELIKGEK